MRRRLLEDEAFKNKLKLTFIVSDTTKNYDILLASTAGLNSAKDYIVFTTISAGTANKAVDLCYDDTLEVNFGVPNQPNTKTVSIGDYVYPFAKYYDSTDNKYKILTPVATKYFTLVDTNPESGTPPMSPTPFTFTIGGTGSSTTTPTYAIFKTTTDKGLLFPYNGSMGTDSTALQYAKMGPIVMSASNGKENGYYIYSLPITNNKVTVGKDDRSGQTTTVNVGTSIYVYSFINGSYAGSYTLTPSTSAVIF